MQEGPCSVCSNPRCLCRPQSAWATLSPLSAVQSKSRTQGQRVHSARGAAQRGARPSSAHSASSSPYAPPARITHSPRRHLSANQGNAPSGRSTAAPQAKPRQSRKSSQRGYMQPIRHVKGRLAASTVGTDKSTVAIPCGSDVAAPAAQATEAPRELKDPATLAAVDSETGTHGAGLPGKGGVASSVRAAQAATSVVADETGHQRSRTEAHSRRRSGAPALPLAGQGQATLRRAEARQARRAAARSVEKLSVGATSAARPESRHAEQNRGEVPRKSGCLASGTSYVSDEPSQYSETQQGVVQAPACGASPAETDRQGAHEADGAPWYARDKGMVTANQGGHKHDLPEDSSERGSERIAARWGDASVP